MFSSDEVKHLQKETFLKYEQIHKYMYMYDISLSHVLSFRANYDEINVIGNFITWSVVQYLTISIVAIIYLTQ